MSGLNHTRFSEFFAALYGQSVVPFPWQRRLATRIVEASGTDKVWPQAIALPTSSGKTACIDIAVFALACQAHLPPEKRTAARRIFFVVDRRVIVDEAFERAREIAEKLQAAESGILHEVAEALRLVSGDANADPLACFQLRGGVYRDDAWARTPTQPTIIASTVDQIGSRLLFRGYGVSAGMRPIHAGLAAYDSLIILDEAHCAKPFMQTLLAMERYRQWGEQPLTAPFRVVLMSATPPPELTDVLKAETDDYDDPILGKRLSASKPTRLVEVTKATGKKAIEELSQELAKQALAFAEGDTPQAVAVIVNRIAVARRVRELLAEQTTGDVVLIMGRMRPIDRDAVTQDWLTRLNATKAGTRELTRHVFIVATQCLEVGANLDFDALVTECATLDALRQRFGRLNRSGRDIKARGVIVIRADQTKLADKPTDEDPIYGNALPRTWSWLKRNATAEEIDFGVYAVGEFVGAEMARDPEEFRMLLAPSESAPVMFPAYVDCWAQTSPEPAPSPDVSIFLHGPDRSVPDVQVCWRADLPLGDSDGKTSIDILSLCPPASPEIMRVPFAVFVRWFAGEDSADTRTGDVEGSAVPDELPNPQNAPARSAIRWLGPDKSELVKEPRKIKPGDTLVLAANAGGWNLFGHVPDDRATPDRIDAGGEANLNARATPVLRLHETLVRAWPECPAKQSALALLHPVSFAERLGSADYLNDLHETLGAIKDEPRLLEWLRDSAAALAKARSKLSRRLAPYPAVAGCGVILRSPDRIAKYARSGQSEFTDEDDSSSVSEPRLLRDHCEDVALKLRKFVAGCALPNSVAEDAILAASLHDLGKADPRFQALLRGGGRRAVGELLAKSDRMPEGRQAYIAARDRAGYPAGNRHELFSVRLVESAASLLAGAADSELVLHLIASHHGYARPFAPFVDDPTPENVELQWNGTALSASSRTGLERLDSGVAERFWRLVRRYGWWGLAYLEALLRLADHRASENGKREKQPTAAAAQ